MPRIEQQPTSLLPAVSDAMVTLHKEQFGRGPTNARSHFAGPDGLVCVLRDVLLPAELKLVAMGENQRVLESRMALQVAAADEFVAAIERILGRTVKAFASAADANANTVFENFTFEPVSSDGGGPEAP